LIPDFLEAATASYLRILATMAFGVTAYLGISEDPRYRGMVRGAIVLFGTITIGTGVWEAVTGFDLGLGGSTDQVRELSWRFGGILGIDWTGLVSGLLLVHTVVSRGERSDSRRWMISLLASLAGMFLAKSAMSMFAAAGTATVYMIATSTRRSTSRMVGLVAMGGLVALIAGWAVWALRPAEVEGLLGVSGGSFAQRLVLLYAGLRIFWEHPVFGVGWQASGTSPVIGASTLNGLLMDTFPAMSWEYFFLERPLALHNMYIQFLAELGLVGAILFAYGVVATWRTVSQIRRETNGSPAVKFYSLGLLFLLLWWNGHSLYGGQLESALACVFLGGLAAEGRLAKREQTAAPPSLDASERVPASAS
jgi:O-antigen ligase